MTGPEHYREAERISAAITHRGNLDEGDHRDVLMLAQLHATLALAAATALHGASVNMTGPATMSILVSSAGQADSDWATVADAS